MRTYLQSIKYTQIILLVISITILAVLPLTLTFYPDFFTTERVQDLFSVSHWFLIFVMLVRPLADIFTNTKLIRPLVILRKGAGVLSASIVVSFILTKLMTDPAGYVESIATLHYWSFANYSVLAHIADITAVLLLITSNNLSKRLLGSWWKKIQKLSYVYFYGSALYVVLLYGNIDLLIAIILVTVATYIAFIKNRKRTELAQKTVQTA